MGRKSQRESAKKTGARHGEAGRKTSADRQSRDETAPTTEPSALESDATPASQANQANPATPTKTSKKRRRTFLKRIISARRIGQVAFGATVYLDLANGWVSLGILILAGGLLGVILGKFFCRWMCPIGLMMDLIMGAGPQAQSNLYMYYKLGCPIAWISGFLNRFSLFKVRRKQDACVNCGLCDKACYITKFNPETSLYKKDGINPSSYYTCSRCLECIQVCPTNALTLAIKAPSPASSHPNESAQNAE